jgi:hypothetical protein
MWHFPRNVLSLFVYVIMSLLGHLQFCITAARRMIGSCIPMYTLHRHLRKAHWRIVNAGCVDWLNSRWPIESSICSLEFKLSKFQQQKRKELWLVTVRTRTFDPHILIRAWSKLSVLLHCLISCKQIILFTKLHVLSAFSAKFLRLKERVFGSLRELLGWTLVMPLSHMLTVYRVYWCLPQKHGFQLWFFRCDREVPQFPCS